VETVLPPLVQTATLIPRLIVPITPSSLFQTVIGLLSLQTFLLPLLNPRPRLEFGSVIPEEFGLSPTPSCFISVPPLPLPSHHRRNAQVRPIVAVVVVVVDDRA